MNGTKAVIVTLWAAPHQMVTLACKLERVSTGAQCHWIHAPNIYIHQNVNDTTKKARHNLQMNYSTGICSIEFKPDYSDLGRWTCKFSKRDKDTDIELGSATLVLLNTIADEKLGWIVGALTAIVLFLMIIVVVLVVCKTRLFVRRSPEILETLPASIKGKNIQCGNDGRIQNDNYNITNTNNILPNRSPHLYERVEKHVAPSKLYENFGL